MDQLKNLMASTSLNLPQDHMNRELMGAGHRHDTTAFVTDPFDHQSNLDRHFELQPHNRSPYHDIDQLRDIAGNHHQLSGMDSLLNERELQLNQEPLGLDRQLGYHVGYDDALNNDLYHREPGHGVRGMHHFTEYEADRGLGVGAH